MSCFDTVLIRCPFSDCGQATSLESKGGRCGLDHYTSSAVPLAIAIDLDGEQIQCGGCRRWFSVLIAKPHTVELKLIPRKMGYPNPSVADPTGPCPGSLRKASIENGSGYCDVCGSMEAVRNGHWVEHERACI